MNALTTIFRAIDRFLDSDFGYHAAPIILGVYAVGLLVILGFACA